MKVENYIRVYEVNGQEIIDTPDLKVKSHWNYSDRIMLEYGDFKITVLVRDMEKAIANASNFR